MNTKDGIRPLYYELQGYLAQAPPIGDHGTTTTNDVTLWRQFSLVIDALSKITDGDFSRFKVTEIKINHLNREYIDVSNYRQKLGGIIAHLHGKYFADEQPPFSGMPNTIINTHQTQHQTQSINLLLDLHERIISEMPKHEPGSKERRFLEELKSSLATIGEGLGVIDAILHIGTKVGLGLEAIRKLVGV